MEMEQEPQTAPVKGSEMSPKQLDVQNTHAPMSGFKPSGFEDWELGLTIVLAVACFIALSAVMAGVMSYKRKVYFRRQQFNERMSQLYDSISISGSLPALDQHIASHFRDSVSTIFTVISTPTSSRKSSLTQSVDQEYPESSITNISSPSPLQIKVDYKFSLEDTAKKLQELDDDNIARIRASYWSNCEEDSTSLNVEAGRALEDSVEGENIEELFNKAVLKLDNVLSMECSDL